MAVWSSKVPSDARISFSLSMKRAMQAQSISSRQLKGMTSGLSAPRLPPPLWWTSWVPRSWAPALLAQTL